MGVIINDFEMSVGEDNKETEGELLNVDQEMIPEEKLAPKEIISIVQHFQTRKFRLFTH